MKRINKKSVIGLTGVIIIIAVIIAGVAYKRSLDNNTNTSTGGAPTVAYMHGSFSIDTDNLEELAGDADYVFVAKVIETKGTQYKYPVTVEDESGNSETVTTPYTDYTVSVEDNIKGELVESEAITIQKAGGVTEDGKYTVIYEDDTLPEEGKNYIFFAYAQDDGSLLVSGPSSNVSIQTKDETASIKQSTLEKNAKYNEVVDAVANQIETDRDRSISKYDTSQ